MNPNDTITVSDEIGSNSRLRLLLSDNMCIIDSNRVNNFKIATAGKYILQGYTANGSINLTHFEIKTKQLAAPVTVGLIAYCNNIEDTFFVQINKVLDYNKYQQGSFAWYFSNSIQNNTWPIEYTFLATLVGNYRYTCLDKNGNLFKSANLYVTCGNKIPESITSYETIDLLNQGYICYDITGRVVIPYEKGYFILVKNEIIKKIFIVN